MATPTNGRAGNDMQRTYKVVHKKDSQAWQSIAYVKAANEAEARRTFSSDNSGASIMYLIDCAYR